MSLINSDFLSNLPYEIIILLLTKYTDHCVFREKRLLFINQFTKKRLVKMTNILSRIPKLKYRRPVQNIQYSPNSIVTLNICARLISDNDMKNHNLQKYFNPHMTQNELSNGKNEVYIHKSYTIHSATDFLDKHSRRLCILYFYKDGEKYPYSRTFNLPASELELDSE